MPSYLSSSFASTPCLIPFLSTAFDMSVYCALPDSSVSPLAEEECSIRTEKAVPSASIALATASNPFPSVMAFFTASIPAVYR